MKLFYIFMLICLLALAAQAAKPPAAKIQLLRERRQMDLAESIGELMQETKIRSEALRRMQTRMLLDKHGKKKTLQT